MECGARRIGEHNNDERPESRARGVALEVTGPANLEIHARMLAQYAASAFDANF